MESHVMDGALISQLTSAAMVVYLLQFLKKTSWYARFATWLPIADAHVHRLVSVMGAFLSAVGVHVAFTGSAAAGWHIAATIPPLTVLLHAAWDWAQQFALNQLTYDAVAQRAGSPTITGIAFSTTSIGGDGTAGHGTRVPAFLLVACLGTGMLVSSCAPPPSIVTAPGKVAFTADQVVIRVNEFQKTVIQAEATGGLPTAQARVYIAWTVSADKVLKATPAGWPSTIAASWKETKGKVPAPANPTVAALVAGLDTAMASLGGAR